MTKPFTQILTIEEPELYLHPGAQRQLFHSFKTLAKNGIQVIVTTHSTVFVDRSDASSILLLRRNANAEAMSYHVPSDLKFEHIKEELGFRTSDVFFANCLCLVEGETEEEAFPRLFKLYTNATLDELGLQLVNIKGKTRSPEFLKALREVKIPKVLIVDADAEKDGKRSAAHKPSNLIKEGLIEPDCCFIFDEGEFEDSIPDELLVKALQKAYPNYSDLTLDWLSKLKQQCQQEGKKLTESLQKYLYEFDNRCDDYNKRKVGKEVGELAMMQDIPKKIQDYFSRALEFCR